MLKFLVIAKKDLLVEFRTKHTINFMLLFAAFTLLMFSYIVGIYVFTVPNIVPGLLWLVFIFTGLIGLSKAFIRENDIGTLDGLKLSPVSPESILIGKTIYNLVLMLLVEAVTFPIFLVFFNVTVKGSVITAFFVITLGILGFVIISSILSVLVMNAKSRELLLPIIVLPILLPEVIVSIIVLKEVIVEGASFINIIREVIFILAYTVIWGFLSFLTFEYAIEE